jgi:DNA-binding NarL/FixJ family response regulator/tetratricopeptide (TPR) repeat protein
MSEGVPKAGGRKTLPNVMTTLPEDAYRPEDRPASRPPAPDSDALRRLEAWSRQEPVVVLIASEDLRRTLRPALELKDLRVHLAEPGDAISRVSGLAPDLVVLEEALDGIEVLKTLSADPRAGISPVVVLSAQSALAQRLDAFRHGAALVLSVESAVADLAREIEAAARGTASREAKDLAGAAGEATLDELVGTLEKELRTGILSVWPAGVKDAHATRLVLGGGRPLTAAIDAFVRTIRENLVSAEALRFEFEEHTGGEVEEVSDAESTQDVPEAELLGLRVMLVDSDAPRMDAVATALREKGVEVVVSDLAPAEARFRRLRTTDVAAVLIARHDAERSGYDFIRDIRRDVRLRWSRLLLVNWAGVWDEGSGASLDTLLPVLTRLHHRETELTHAADDGPLATRVELLGPARLLRALASGSALRRATVNSRRVRVEIDFEGGKVLGARAKLAHVDGPELEGAEAIAAFLVIATGSVRVARVDSPLSTSLMETPVAVMERAEKQPEPLQPSVYAPPISERLRRIAPPKPPSDKPPPPEPAAAVQLTESDVFDMVEALGSPEDEAPSASSPPPATVSQRKSDLPSTTRSAQASSPKSDGDRAAHAPALKAETTKDEAAAAGWPKPESGDERAAQLPALDLSTATRDSVRAFDAETEGASAGSSSGGWLWLLAALVVGGVLLALFRSGGNEDAAPAATAPATGTAALLAAPLADGSPEPTSALPPPVVPPLPQKNRASCDELLSSVPAPQGVYPGAALAKLQQAREAAARKSLDEAHISFCHGLRFDPDSTGGNAALARLLLELRDGAQALSFARAALPADTAEPEAHWLVADALALSGKYDEARKILAQPGPVGVDAAATQKEAAAALAAGKPTLAERLYVRTLILRPDNVVAAKGVAAALAAQELPEAKTWDTFAAAVQKRKAL